MSECAFTSDVFLSHSSKDKAVEAQFQRAQRAREFKALVAELNEVVAA